MFYFWTNPQGYISNVSTTPPPPDKAKEGWSYQCRVDWANREQAEFVAKEINEIYGFQTPRYYVVDYGPNCSPRWDVVRDFQVDEFVSRGFNGDYYPEGVVVKKTRTSFTTSTGLTFRKNRAGFYLYDRMWAAVHGHKNERNPHL